MTLSKLNTAFSAVQIVTVGVLVGTSSFASLMTPDELGLSSKVLATPYAATAVGYEKANQSASPEQIARAFLAQASSKLGLKSDLSDLRMSGVQTTPAGSTVRFEQMVNGQAVDQADVVVTVAGGEVVTLISNYAKLDPSGLEKVSSVPQASFSKEAALQKVYAELALTASPTSQTVEERITVIDGKARPVYFITIAAPVDHKYGFEFVVDADSGAILRSRDATIHKDAIHKDAIHKDAVDKDAVDKDTVNKASASPVAISANVFDPNPTLKSGKIYGSVAGYEDANNADSAFFNSMYTKATLDNLTLKGSKVTLVGPNVQIVDLESPKNANCDVDSAQKTWTFTRSNACFDAVNAYYFVDKTLRYLNTTLGFNAHPLKYTGGIKVDPQGVAGDDNSHYVETSDYLAFGEGGVDDAQDHDVVIHELGHAIHSWVTGGHISQVEGLSEGIGDYWAASYDRQFSKPGDVYRDWTFSYDGHNPFWPGRDVANKGKYPSAAQGEIHDAGTLWATTCIEIYDVIGKAKADKAFWSGISMLTANSSQNDAAKAYVAAARKLYPTDTNLINTVIAKFTARGYTVK